MEANTNLSWTRFGIRYILLRKRLSDPRHHHCPHFSHLLDQDARLPVCNQGLDYSAEANIFHPEPGSGDQD
jgi:hypothetical protein